MLRKVASIKNHILYPLVKQTNNPPLFYLFWMSEFLMFWFLHKTSHFSACNSLEKKGLEADSSEFLSWPYNWLGNFMTQFPHLLSALPPLTKWHEENHVISLGFSLPIVLLRFFRETNQLYVYKAHTYTDQWGAGKRERDFKELAHVIVRTGESRPAG